MEIRDMPKLESPFVREMINGHYVVTPKIAEGCEWVFAGGEDEVLCTEKLNGTDVSIIIEGGKITRLFNRMNEIPIFNKNQKFITEAVLNSFEKGYCDFSDGQYFGEVIGPKLDKKYRLDCHLWLPFNTYVREHLAYKSWHKHPKTFENISNWFQQPVPDGGIFSLFLRKRGIIEKPEGVVFHNLKTGQMAKLRMDMWDWYTGRRHEGTVSHE